MTYDEARAAAAADPKIKAAVETAPSLPLRDSDEYEVELFTLVRDASAMFRKIFKHCEESGWSLVVGGLGRGFAVFQCEDQVFGVNLDKRSLVRGIDTPVINGKT